MQEKKLIESLEKKIQKQNEIIKILKKEITQQNKHTKQLIEEEVAKTIFHHIKSLQHRIDQFIFDTKITLKNTQIKNPKN